jgi:hypothetical protein
VSTRDELAAALAFDPLAAAEAMTGISYKEDDETSMLGLALSLNHNRRKDALLKSSRDTTFSMPFDDHLAVFVDMGFEEVYRQEFDGRYARETYLILWHADGLLATTESFSWSAGDKGRNTAKVYYNYRRAAGLPGCPLTSSGHMEGDVWIGYHDVREGMRHTIECLRAEGEFLPAWVARPFLWLLNYAESDKPGYDYEAINARKIVALPADIQAAIAGAR